MPEAIHPDGSHARRADAGILRLSSDALRERDRVAVVCEFFARQVLHVDVEPLAGHPFHADLTITLLPGLGVLSSRNSAIAVGRTKKMLEDGDDGVVVQLAGSRIVATQLGREVMLGSGDATTLSNGDLGSIIFPEAGEFVSLLLPRNALGPLLRDVDGCIGRLVPGSTPALRLLGHYLEILKNDSEMATPELQSLMATHVYDLVAVALGATRDAAELAKGRGVRAAHLHAIKRDIIRRVDGKLSPDTIAARHRLTPRYMRKLFEDEGTTFTEFVREQRLVRAHRMLISRRFDHRRIGDIAFEVGYSDLSYFNRSFRRRFGTSPSELRKSSN